VASDNYTNSDLFNSNISNSEDIIKQLKSEKIFLDDIKILEEQLSIIKKTFNRIESWKESDKHLVYRIPENYKNSLIKVLKIEKKLYLITKTAII
jgi:hypothetical protein